MPDKRLSIKLLPTMAAIVLLAAAAAAMLGRDHASSINVSAAESPVADAIGQDQAENRYPQLVRVWVHPEDIYPEVISVRPGKVLIRAENQSLSDISLILERLLPGQGRQSVATVRVVGSQKRAEGVYSLGPGEYTFYEETRPDIRGTLLVEPK